MREGFPRKRIQKREDPANREIKEETSETRKRINELREREQTGGSQEQVDASKEQGGEIREAGPGEGEVRIRERVREAGLKRDEDNMESTEEYLEKIPYDLEMFRLKYRIDKMENSIQWGRSRIEDQHQEESLKEGLRAEVLEMERDAREMRQSLYEIARKKRDSFWENRLEDINAGNIERIIKDYDASVLHEIRDDSALYDGPVRFKDQVGVIAAGEPLISCHAVGKEKGISDQDANVGRSRGVILRDGLVTHASWSGNHVEEILDIHNAEFKHGDHRAGEMKNKIDEALKLETWRRNELSVNSPDIGALYIRRKEIAKDEDLLKELEGAEEYSEEYRKEIIKTKSFDLKDADTIDSSVEIGDSRVDIEGELEEFKEYKEVFDTAKETGLPIFLREYNNLEPKEKIFEVSGCRLEVWETRTRGLKKIFARVVFDGRMVVREDQVIERSGQITEEWKKEQGDRLLSESSPDSLIINSSGGPSFSSYGLRESASEYWDERSRALEQQEQEQQEQEKRQREREQEQQEQEERGKPEPKKTRTKRTRKKKGDNLSARRRRNTRRSTRWGKRNKGKRKRH